LRAAIAIATHEAVAPLYFADNSDYAAGLYDVVKVLNPALWAQLEDGVTSAHYEHTLAAAEAHRLAVDLAVDRSRSTPQQFALTPPASSSETPLSALLDEMESTRVWLARAARFGEGVEKAEAAFRAARAAVEALFTKQDLALTDTKKQLAIFVTVAGDASQTANELARLCGVAEDVIESGDDGDILESATELALRHADELADLRSRLSQVEGDVVHFKEIAGRRISQCNELSATIARVEGERDAWREQCQDAKNETFALAARVEALLGAIKEYGYHTADCATWLIRDVPCTCRFAVSGATTAKCPRCSHRPYLCRWVDALVCIHCWYHRTARRRA